METTMKCARRAYAHKPFRKKDGLFAKPGKVITRVDKSQKFRVCGHCRTAIQKGSPYFSVRMSKGKKRPFVQSLCVACGVPEFEALIAKNDGKATKYIRS